MSGEAGGGHFYPDSADEENDPSSPEDSSSLAAMIQALRDGEDVDMDALRDELVRTARANGAPGKLVGLVMGRARWQAERARRLEENRGEEE